MVMYRYAGNGAKPEELPIPESEKEKASQLHKELVETIAANDGGPDGEIFRTGRVVGR